MNSEDFKVLYLGLYNEVVNFKVFVNGHWFDYTMGMGHVVPNDPKKSGMTRYKVELTDCGTTNAALLNALNVDKRKFLSVDKIAFYSLYQKTLVVYQPKLNDVLNSLYIDSQVGELLFEDFCGEFGYDSDSRKALEIYLKCQDTCKKMRYYCWPDEIINGDY